MSYRMGIVEGAVANLNEKFAEHLVADNASKVLQGQAIQRCERHDADLLELRNRESSNHEERKLFITQMQEALAQTIVEQVKAAVVTTDRHRALTGRTWPDVFFHPATGMAFCIVVMMIFFGMYISANTGRNINTIIPGLPHGDTAPAPNHGQLKE